MAETGVQGVSALAWRIAVCAALGASLAAPAAAQTLQDALILAYQHNPQILSQRAHLRAQDEEVAQAIAGWRPTVTVNANVGRQAETRVFGSGGTNVAGAVVGTSGGGGLNDITETFTPRAGALVVTQNIYRGGRIEAQIRSSDFLVMVERARLGFVETTILLQAATFYVDVVRDQATLELNINNEQVLAKQLESTQDRFTVGEVTRTDVAQAEAALSQAKAQREAAYNQLHISRANYRNIMGEVPGRLIDPGEPDGLPGSREEAVSLAQIQNFNVQIADYVERAAQENVNIQFGGLLPTISLQGTLSKTTEQFSRQDDTELAQILAILSIPIYTGGLVEAQTREAKELVGQRRLELETAQLAAIQSATQAWENLQSARAQEVSFQAAIQADAVALEGVQQEASAGLRTVLDILNAEQLLLTARVSLVSAHHDAIVAAYTVLNAAGRLTARDRRLPIEYYDPTEHYFEVRDKWFGTGIKNEVKGTPQPNAQ